MQCTVGTVTTMAYLGFWKGGQGLNDEGADGVSAGSGMPLPLRVTYGEGAIKQFFNFVNENGVFQCTLEHCLKLMCCNRRPHARRPWTAHVDFE